MKTKRLLVVVGIEQTHFTKRHVVHFGYIDVPEEMPIAHLETADATIEPGMLKRALENVEKTKG